MVSDRYLPTYVNKSWFINIVYFCYILGIKKFFRPSKCDSKHIYIKILFRNILNKEVAMVKFVQKEIWKT